MIKLLPQTDPIKFFDEYHYGDDVVKDLKEMAVGEKYNVDEMMQDIEILRYNSKMAKNILVKFEMTIGDYELAKYIFENDRICKTLKY